MFGYHQKLLRIDLTNRRIEVEHLNKEYIQKYIGGVGFKAKSLYEETNPETAPLSRENTLMAITGPYTGTGVAASGRRHGATRSP